MSVKKAQTFSQMMHEIQRDPVRKARVLKMRNACRVAEEVYRIRTEHELSQKKTAELFKVKPSFVSRLEDGDYTCLHESIVLLHKMAKHFSTKINLNLLPEESSEKQND